MRKLFRDRMLRNRRKQKSGRAQSASVEALERRALLTNQLIGSSLPALDVAPGQAFEVPITYRTTNASGGSAALSSDMIDFNLHFDQDQITFDGITNLFEEDIVVQPNTTTSESDAAITGDDNDAATETVLRARYVDAGNDGWPNNLPTNGIVTYLARFTASNSFTGSRLNFSANETGTGFSFQGTSVDLQLQSGPVVSLSNSPIVTEGDAANFTVTLSETVNAPVTVTYSTQDGNGPNGAFAGEDYDAQLNQTVTFAAGETQKTISVTTIDDSFIESDKFFSLRILSVQGAQRGQATREATIQDDDAGSPQLAIQDAPAVVEGATAMFEVTLSRASDTAVTVRYTTTDGNGPEGATNGVDFASTTNELLTFSPGETSKMISVTTFEDAVIEPQEDFRVVLSDSVGAAISRPNGLGLINNNNSDLPALIIQDAAEVTEGGVSSFTVTLSEASDSEVTVDFSTADGNGPLGAMAGEDFTAQLNVQLTFPAGTTSQTISINTIDNSIEEPTETFTVVLSNPSGAVISDASGTGTILDDDGSGIAGDVDGNGSFDANDAFLIHLVQLSGTDASIDQFKGASTLAATQIRANVEALENNGGDVDGVGGFTANDSFLIQLVQLSGTDASIDQFKGASTLTAAQIRANVNALGGASGNRNFGGNSFAGNNSGNSSGGKTAAVMMASPDADNSTTDEQNSSDPAFTSPGSGGTLNALQSDGSEDYWSEPREWMDMLVLR